MYMLKTNLSHETNHSLTQMVHYTITTYGSDKQILNIDEMGMAYHYLEIKVKLLLQIFTNPAQDPQ